MSKNQVSTPAPIIIPALPPPREPDEPHMVEKTTLDVISDTTLARITANGAHLLTEMAIRYAAAQAETAREVNPDIDPLLAARFEQYQAMYDLTVQTAYRRIARPLKLDGRRR